MKKQYIALVFLLLGVAAHAQQNLDFWLGHWDAYSLLHQGALVGENHISKTLGGKVYFEHWTDCMGIEGHSFSLFDSTENCWKQTWVDNRGNILEFKGLLRNDSIIFTTRPSLGKDGRTAINRMTITRVSPDELLQVGEISYDNAQAWSTNYRFKYLRKSADAAAFYIHAPKPLAYFAGQIEYEYVYQSASINADSLAKTRSRSSIFRFDGFNYQSCFIGKDTATYFYDGSSGRCLSRSGKLGKFECEDYSIATDSVLSWRIVETEEKVLGQSVCILEIQGRYFFTRYFVSREMKMSPFVWQKHLAYNWSFYGDKAEGGLILKLEHHFKNYTMFGVAKPPVAGGPGFKALELEAGTFEKNCK